MTILSVLDLAPIAADETPAQALAHSVDLARAAEESGYTRVWYAEHHNMARIASSATSVLIAHVAAHTASIRLGAGGVMLPNHSPLTIAEQFGTLATLHPGRIDLGLGRAPGGDRAVFAALRRDPTASDAFPQDVLELQAYLGDESRVHGVEATPGKGTHVPLYILGSSLFGAQARRAVGAAVRLCLALCPRSARAGRRRLPGGLPAVRAGSPSRTSSWAPTCSPPPPARRRTSSSSPPGARACA
ncbi:hypothetical protein GCM10025876_26190 [Demequina litorisediminis]|uniref:Luciferase-like domain-containing protein n=1 Tax=Demequina litorisediminis TaxID=1849022 RepID=A0ABQ6IEY4_9MICO|nr:hypothetical protein GCM10025876_26190 [Demequina litorisediminis]